MIKIILKNSNTVEFNLKSFEREKLLKDAWYSMADVHKFRNKRLKIKTDTDMEYNFKIEEIESCEFFEKVQDYTNEPVKETPNIKTEVKEESSVFGDIFKDLGGMDGLVKEMINSISDEDKRKMFSFIDGLRSNRIPIDLNDMYLMETIQKVLQSKEEEIPLLVEKYRNYWKNKIS